MELDLSLLQNKSRERDTKHQSWMEKCEKRFKLSEFSRGFHHSLQVKPVTLP